MLFYFLQGVTLALSATITPGPFQAYLLSQALRNGWKRTLPAAFSPLATDGPIITLVLFVLTQASQNFLEILRIAGGLFILYLAVRIVLTMKGPEDSLSPAEGAGRQTFIHAALMNFLNPNPYIFWGIVGGPIALSGWRSSPGLGVIFFVGFYGTFVCALAALIILFASAGRVNPRLTRILGGVAGLALAAFGLYQVVTGLRAVI